MSFLGEIKRRKVFQVAAVYAVVAWLAVQIVATVEEPLNLPGWVDTLVIVLLLVGFPIAVVIAWAFDLTPEGIRPASEVQAADVRAQPAGQMLNTAILVLMALAVGFLIVDQYVLDDARPLAATEIASEATSRVTRLSIVQPAGQPVRATNLIPVLAISPDGTKAVYAASNEGRWALVVRTLDSLESTVLYEGNPFTPFFSPDGAWVGFADQSERDLTLKRIAVTGGPALTIASHDAPRLRGATWGEDGTIIYGIDPISSGLWQVPASGGTPEPFTTLDESRNEVSHRWPHLLPGGEAVLFSIFHEGGDSDTAEIAVRDLNTGEQRLLVSGGSYPTYAPAGHIVYSATGTLRAVPFDLDRLTVTGNPVGVLEGVYTMPPSGAANVAISQDGTLAYLPAGRREENPNTAVWVDRDGNEEPIGIERPDRYADPSISPDGTRVALAATEGYDADIWIWSSLPRTFSRLTFEPEFQGAPFWSPDGTRIVYYSNGEGLVLRRADGVGTVERVFETVYRITPAGWTQEGQILVTYQAETSGLDIGLVSMDGERTLTPVLAMPFTERRPALSPDGRWMAYQSDESGRFEVYVRPYPDVDAGKWQVSSTGGQEPQWSPDGETLFFRAANNLMATDITAASGFVHSTPEAVLDASDYRFSTSGRAYDIGPDGRFLMITDTDVRDAFQIHVVLNWFTELERLVPTSE